MSESSSPRVAVVGAGMIGRAVAWRLACAGADVTVFDPDPTRAAGRVAAGMLAAVTEAEYGEVALLAANRDAVTRWPDFAAELEAESGSPCWHATTGAVSVAVDADELAVIDHHGEFLLECGLAVERLSGRDARRTEPALSPSTRGAWWVPGDTQVDPRAVLVALGVANERRGVAVETAEVGAVTATGVTATDGREWHVDAVVVTAGWATGTLLGLPIRPVKGQILRLRDTGRSVLPSSIVRGVEVYVVPRPSGEIVVGATSEDRGPDRSVTAGAVRHLLDEARRVVPGIDEAELVETAAGLRPATPDHAPVLDTIDGVFVAAGHHRNGVLLSPWTADAVVAAVVGDGWPTWTAPFRADRFTNGTANADAITKGSTTAEATTNGTTNADATAEATVSESSTSIESGDDRG